MVGVPGRSKGCHACRKQKIACSQERPECFICRKVGRVCPGYQRDRIFVNLTPPKSDAEATVKQQRYLASSKQPSRPENRSENPQVNVEEHNCTSTSIQVSRSTAPVLQRSLTIGAYRNQLLGAFLSRYEARSRPSESFAESHWLTAVPARPALSRALDVAAVAFCTAKLGRVARDTGLVTESLSLYSCGLRELQRALFDPSQMYSDDTLGACILLAMYEAFECPSRNQKGYLSHVAGCARLIHLRGPEAHAEGLGHLIFKSFRFIATLEALSTKVTFLDSPSWMTLPFTRIGKSPLNRLLDLLLEAPALLRQSDALGTMRFPDEQLHGAVGLAQGCLNLEMRQRVFYDELVRSAPADPLYWETPMGEDALETRALFPIVYAFPDVHTASTLMLYWATGSLLRNGLCRLKLFIEHLQGIVEALAVGQALGGAAADVPAGSSPPAKDSPSSRNSSAVEIPTTAAADSPTAHSAATAPSFPTSIDMHSFDFATPAYNVCRSVPFCLDLASETDLGLSAITAPLHMVLDVLRSWGDATTTTYAAEQAWIRRVLETVKVRGIGIVEFLDGTRS